MAKKKDLPSEQERSETEDFTNELIASLNRDLGEQVAYNLLSDTSPTHIKRWISTGSRQLDYIVSNRAGGGLPEGRIVEIFGPPSIGKSHIAAQIAKSVQHMGGIAVYIDTENATNPENLVALGVDIGKRFVYVDTHCTEEVFDIAEKTILKAKALSKNIPIVIIWDSVAASSPKAELDGEYEQNSIGLQARTISKGMRKITGVIGDQNVLFVCLNQTRSKIGGYVLGDGITVPGGVAIPFHASVRIKLGAGSQIKDSKGTVIGIHVSAKTIKNKVAPPFRACNFRIYFGVGIVEHEEIFDILREHGPDLVDNHQVEIKGAGAYKHLIVSNESGQLFDKSFYKAGFDEIMVDEKYSKWIDGLLGKAMTRSAVTKDDVEIDHESYEEIRAVADLVAEESNNISPE